MLASLAIVLFATLSARSEVALNDEDAKALAEFKIECDTMEMNFDSCERALNICEKEKCETNLTSSQTFFWISVGLAFIAGAAVNGGF